MDKYATLAMETEMSSANYRLSPYEFAVTAEPRQIALTIGLRGSADDNVFSLDPQPGTALEPMDVTSSGR